MEKKENIMNMNLFSLKNFSFTDFFFKINNSLFFEENFHKFFFLNRSKINFENYCSFFFDDLFSKDLNFFFIENNVKQSKVFVGETSNFFFNINGF
jgi:hypothetical protein